MTPRRNTFSLLLNISIIIIALLCVGTFWQQNNPCSSFSFAFAAGASTDDDDVQSSSVPNVSKIRNFAKNPAVLIESIKSVPKDEWYAAKLDQAVDKTGKLETSVKAVKNPSCSFYSGDRTKQHIPMFEKALMNEQDFDKGGFITLNFANYSAGHYMHAHDDDAVGLFDRKRYRRRRAFILYLTEDWKEEYGGLLRVEETGETILPEYNMLATFQVGMMHSVTKVTAPPGKDRLTMYGWVMTPETAFEKFKSTPFGRAVTSLSLKAILGTMFCGVLPPLGFVLLSNKKRAVAVGSHS